MIINKTNLTEFIFCTSVLILILNNCHVRVNSDNNVSDYYIKDDYSYDHEIKNEKYDQKVYSKYLKSLTFKSNSLILGDPCYYLNSQSSVNIDFDLLKNHSESLQYQIIHCDKDWFKSNISTMDAIEGFDTDYIENQKISYGPSQQYIHCNFKIPNNHTKFLISGNYLIKIFLEGDPFNPMATIKFFVSEQSSTIKFNIDESGDVEQSKYLQSYEVECTYNSSNTIDPFSNIFINIQQNHQTFNQQWLSGPNFIKENKLVFLQNEDQTFNGGNEFRFFDISSFRNGSQFVEKTYFDDSCFKIILKPDQKRSYRQYLEYKDMNGRFFIRTYDYDDSEYQSEYGWVKFKLNMRDQISDSIFIYGQLSNWKTDNSFLMKYDSATKAYHNQILLKQGYYNYIYVTKNSEIISTRKLEGAHFQTNNEYTIKVYYRDPLDMYDRIMCYQNVKSN
jgi:hypothetical protein